LGASAHAATPAATTSAAAQAINFAKLRFDVDAGPGSAKRAGNFRQHWQTVRQCNRRSLPVGQHRGVIVAVIAAVIGIGARQAQELGIFEIRLSIDWHRARLAVQPQKAVIFRQAQNMGLPDVLFKIVR
jgi:hypothetical protein